MIFRMRYFQISILCKIAFRHGEMQIHVVNPIPRMQDTALFIVTSPKIS